MRMKIESIFAVFVAYSATIENHMHQMIFIGRQKYSLHTISSLSESFRSPQFLAALIRIRLLLYYSKCIAFKHDSILPIPFNLFHSHRSSWALRHFHQHSTANAKGQNEGKNQKIIYSKASCIFAPDLVTWKMHLWMAVKNEWGHNANNRKLQSEPLKLSKKAHTKKEVNKTNWAWRERNAPQKKKAEEWNPNRLL